MKRVAALYHQLLNQPALGPEVLQQVHSYAMTNKDYALLAALAKHPGIDDTIDAAIAEIPDARVKAAWATSQKRSVEELKHLALTDKREKVLLPLAQNPEFASEVYDTIAQKGTQKVLLALLTNPSLEDSTRFAAAGRLGTLLSDDLSWRLSSELNVMLEMQPDLASPLAAATKSIVIANMVTEYELSDQVEKHVAGIVIDELLRHGATPEAAGQTGYSNSWFMASSLRRAVGAVLELAQATSNEEVRQMLIAALEKIKRNVKDDTVKSALKDLRAPRGRKQTKKTYSLATARTASDPEQIASIAADARQSRNSAMACALWVNAATPLRELETLCDLIDWNHLPRILQARAGDPEVLGLLIAERCYWVDLDRTLAKLPQPQQTLRHALDTLVKNGSVVPEAWLSSRYLNIEMVRRLPVAVVGRPDLPGPVAESVSKMLVDALGANQQRWEIFSALAETTDAALEDVLESVTCLETIG